MKTYIKCNVTLVSLVVASQVFLTGETAAYAKGSKVDKKHVRSESCESARRFSGNISWYGVPFHGRRTACGQIYDMNKLTAAHLTLPFGTRILIENPRNGKSVIVEINDRGPFIKGRIMDVSREAARKLGTLIGGIAYVNCLVIGDYSHKSAWIEPPGKP